MRLVLLLTVIALFGFQREGSSAISMINVGTRYNECNIEYNFYFRSSTETINSVLWNFGDGTSYTIVSPLASEYHSYTTSGTYTVTAQITSTAGTYTISVTQFFLGNNNSGGAGFSASVSGLTHTFTYTGVSFDVTWQAGHAYTLDFGDGSNQTGTALFTGIPIGSHTYSQPGNYTVTLTHTFSQRGFPGFSCSWTSQYQIVVPEDPCCTSFSPDPGSTYWLSAWVQEDVTVPVIGYSSLACIELEFVISGGNQLLRLVPSGDIIEGWQRIAGSFTVPSGTTALKVNLVNENLGIEAYFDDIRIHPFNGSMKSYVYDPETLWLAAELDDSNYATFYEYDKEGQLLRTKKETERGVFTIKESRSSQKKKD